MPLINDSWPSNSVTIIGVCCLLGRWNFTGFSGPGWMITGVTVVSIFAMAGSTIGGYAGTGLAVPWWAASRVEHLDYSLTFVCVNSPLLIIAFSEVL